MKRRHLILGTGGIALSGWALIACGGGSDNSTATTPVNTTYAGTMPDESAVHTRTWMGFTSSTAIWGSDLAAIQVDLIAIANAIAAFEPVSMLVSVANKPRAQTLLNSAVNKANITLVDASLNDLWLRDTGCVFTKNKTGSGFSAVDFNFNGWGNKQVHDLDATVAAHIASLTGLTRIRSGLVLEGGGIEVDGDGTAIIKESCMLNSNRNPGVSKAACELELKRLLGLDKIIWLPGPAGGDITDAHTDFYARFTSPGTVVVSHDAADTYGEQTVTQNHINALTGKTDAKGRTLNVQIINVPTNPSSANANSADFAAGYINFYVCNGAVILPKFGDAAADLAAKNKLTALYPGRAIVQLTINAIAAGGGGIHCTTQQQPA